MSVPTETNMVISSPQLINYTQSIFNTTTSNVMHNLYIPSVCASSHSELHNNQCSKSEVYDCANDMVNIVIIIIYIW